MQIFRNRCFNCKVHWLIAINNAEVARKVATYEGRTWLAEKSYEKSYRCRVCEFFNIPVVLVNVQIHASLVSNL